MIKCPHCEADLEAEGIRFASMNREDKRTEVEVMSKPGEAWSLAIPMADGIPDRILIAYCPKCEKILGIMAGESGRVTNISDREDSLAVFTSSKGGGKA